MHDYFKVYGVWDTKMHLSLIIVFHFWRLPTEECQIVNHDIYISIVTQLRICIHSMCMLSGPGFYTFTFLMQSCSWSVYSYSIKIERL
jgi:hypothetical protein